MSERDGMIEIVNPVLRGMYPDPSWMWDGRSEHVAIVNSSFELVPGLPIHMSDDLAHWRLVGPAVDEDMARRLLLRFVLDSGGLYAPTLRRIAGRYVIVCTVARLDFEAAAQAGVDPAVLGAVRASQGNFVLEADALEGPWRGPYWVVGAEGIDPDVFEDVDGAVYWTQTRPAKHARWRGQTEVWTQRIDPATWRLCTAHDADGDYGKTVIWSGYGVEAVWAEGPHLYRLGDWVYLMTAEGGTSFDHSEIIMRASAPDGLGLAMAATLERMRASDVRTRAPRADERSVVGCRVRLFHPDSKNPFLTHRHLGTGERVQCVGHADLLHHPRLGWWAACLGSRETPTAGHGALSFLGRETFVAPVDWQRDPARWSLDDGDVGVRDDDPGWPVLAGGAGRLAQTLRVDAADGRPHDMRMGPCEACAVIDARAPFDASRDDVVTVRMDGGVVYRRMPEDRCVVLCPSQGTVHMRQDGRHALHVTTDGGVSVRWALDEGDGRRMGAATVPDGTSRQVMLVFVGGEVRMVMADEATQAWRARPIDVVDVAALSTEWSGGFVGCLIGVDG